MTDLRNHRVHVSRHPLIQHFLTLIRDKDLAHNHFAVTVESLAAVLAVESTNTLTLVDTTVTTPLETTSAQRLQTPVILVPILRAGLGMLEPFRRLIPVAQVAHVGMYRNEETLEPVIYYQRIPAETKAATVLILDPMLATGGSASATIDFMKKQKPGQISLISVIAAPEGVQRVQKDHPDVDIFLGALDRQLNEQGYILPGLGDAGDRIFGTE